MSPSASTDPGTLDDAYERLHQTGPEFRGWLSNHGPMAADALIRLGHEPDVRGWIAGYTRRLEPLPNPRWPIDESGWRDPLGDPSRLGDWLRFFEVRVREEPWEDLLTRWWPRLLPGAIASATHGLIRTGHAVRALRAHVTEPRLAELGQALGYWAARWQPIPTAVPPRGALPAPAALDALATTTMDDRWGMRARLAEVSRLDGWPASVGAHASPRSAADVPTALDLLTDAAVTRYLDHASGDPVMLVHSATAPRAAALVLPSVPRSLWTDTYDMAWAVTAAISVAYPRLTAHGPVPEAEGGVEVEPSREEVTVEAAAHGDEHVIKFAEVALESHTRGAANALASAARAAALIDRR